MKNRIIGSLLLLAILVILVSCAPSVSGTSATVNISPSSSSGGTPSDDTATKLNNSTYYQIFDVEEMGIRCVFVDGYENGAMWCVDLP